MADKPDEGPELMVGKDRFDGLMRLAEFRLTRLSRRREYEWRLSLGLWALMAASIVTLKVRPDDWVLFVVLVVIVLLHTYWWITPVGLRNQRDMRMAFYYADRAAQMIGQEANTLRIEAPPTRVKKHSLRLRSLALVHDIWAARLPALITLMLAILAFLLVGKQPAESQPRKEMNDAAAPTKVVPAPSSHK